MSFEEDRAALARLAAGFPAWVDDLGRLVDWLSPLLIPLTQPGLDRSRLLKLRDGRGLLLLPPRLSCREIDTAALEELAHFLLSHGAGDFFRLHGDMSNPRDRALADRWEEREEAEMRGCLLALLLPAALVGLYRSDGELAEAAGVSIDLVQERRRQLRGRKSFVTQPPPWSAWHAYGVTYWPSGLCPRLRIGARVADGRVFEVPVQPADLPRTRWQVNADLVALNLDEFHLKYAAAECAPSEGADLTLTELYAWAEKLFGKSAA